MSLFLKRAFAAASLALLLAIPNTARAQAASDPAAQEVGVSEKLGHTVPLDLVLMDEQGKPVTLRSLINKPTLLTLNYFRCTGICTPQLNALAAVLDKVQSTPGKDFQVLTVSFDPRDTPEMALQKRTNYLAQIHRPFPPDAWRFLTGSAAATKALADSVGFRYERSGDGYLHPGVLMVLSPQGKVTRYMYGISFLPADMDMAIQEASHGQAEPSINKVLAFCFNYDPKGRRYVLDFTKLGMGLSMVAVVIFALVLILKKPKTAPRKEDE